MSQPNWEEIEVPRGAYIGWGTIPGQHATGRVLSYSPVGGTNYKGEICPQLALELIEPAASFNKVGERTDFPVGELVVLNCGQASLKRAVQAAALNPGDLVKITFTATYKSAEGEGKEYAVKVARGAGQAARPAPAPASFAAQPAAAPNNFAAAPPF